MVELEQIIKDLSEVCLCPECGIGMGCYSHFCENCNSRVSVPLDAYFWIEYLKRKYKLKIQGEK